MAKPSKKSAAPGATAPATGASDRVTGWVTLVSGLVISGSLLYRNRWHMEFNEYNLLNIVFIFFVPLCLILLFLRRPLSDFGMMTGELGKGTLVAFVLFLLFVPVILYFAPQAGPQQYYLSWMGPNGGSRVINGIYWEGNAWSKGGTIDWFRLLYHETVMGFYMFAWEWYHRGFLLNGLRRIMPVWGAVLLQALLFMALHWGKPLEETLSSFPGGILIALLALRYKSFLPCFLLHWWVSAGFDFAVLYFHFKK